MYTIDLINLYGGKAANFLDVGGGAQASKIKQSLNLVLKDPKVKAVLINIFGGITRCDEVAKGIVETYRENKYNVPLVIRLQGTNYEEGKRILEEAKGEISFELTEDAEKGAQLVVNMVN
jgi:succinyl-CoA synthetase beta subunit